MSRLAYLGLAVGFAAQAAAPIKSKEWTYEKKVLEHETAETCVVSTQKKVGETLWTLALLVDAAHSAPPRFYVTSDADDVGEKITLQSDSSRTLFLALRDAKADASFNQTAYWFAPNKLSSFYQQIRRDSNVKVSYPGADGKAQTFMFSLSGSMAALDNLNKNCDERKELMYLPFFDALDKQVAKTEPATERGVASLQTQLQDAWSSYLASGTLQTQIKAVDAKIKPYLEKEKAFLTRTGKLNGQLDDLNASKAAIEAKRAKLVSTRDGLVRDLAAVEANLATALADLKTKEDAYRPAAEEARPYFEALQAVTAEVDSYTRNIRSLESDISDATSKISQLEQQERSARSDLDSYERQERDLEPRRVRAQSDLNSFNYQWELRRAIEGDTNMRWIENDIRQNQQNIVNLQQAYRNGQNQLQAAENDLRQCRARGLASDTTSLSAADAAAIPRPGNPGNPGNPGGPRPGPGPRPPNPNPNPGPGPGPGPGPNPPIPPAPPPRPPVDCSREQARVNETQRQLQNVAQALNNEQRNLASNQERLRRRQYEIESAVNAQYQALQRALADIESALSSVRSNINSLESDIEDINRNLIPRQRGIISDARSEIASLQPRLTEAQGRQQQKRSDLNAVLARNGYEAKKAAYLAADARVKDLRNQASNLDAQIKSTESQIATQNKALAKVQVDIDDVLAKLAKETAGLEEIEAVLNPLRADKQKFTDDLASQQQKQQTAMITYRTIYRDTTATTVPVTAPAVFYDWQRF